MTGEVTALMASLVKELHAGDFEAMMSHYSENVVCHLGGNSVISGTHRGRQALVEVLTQSAARLGVPTIQPTWWRDNDDKILILFRASYAPPSFEPFEHEEAVVFRVEGDEITEMWSFDQDQKAVDRCLSR